MCSLSDFGAGGAYSTPPEPLAGFKGPTSKERGGEEMGGEGSGREGKVGDGRRWKGRGGEERGEQGIGHVLTHVSIPTMACLPSD